jgi:hypothetical protein
MYEKAQVPKWICMELHTSRHMKVNGFEKYEQKTVSAPDS